MPNNIINEIITGVKERYQTWSNDLSFATTHENDSALVNPIPFNRSIPDDQLDLRSSETIIEGLLRELVNTEIKDFLIHLNNIIPTVRHTATQIEMVNTFDLTYSDLFQQTIPDFIIWSVSHYKNLQQLKKLFLC